MKTLQNDFTTPEQSKRLLELGVTADSANCFYSHYIKTYAHSEYTEILWHRPRFITEDNKPNWNAILIDGTQTYLPSWTAGRLMEIYEICTSCLFGRRNPKLSILEDVMSQISEDIIATDKCWDFSKLEE